MGIIKLLDDRTVNKIAAGEVIEKPASIVKELVENSIDAGANEISVEIKNGGISLIRVTDNGKGIDRDDMEIAFLRHATSKIASDNDLYSINTLGFRGEALASIAAVSKVEMISKTNENDLGNRIYIDGGRVIEKDQSGSPEGTIITVKDLFFNTPARLKFLKSESREAMYITDTLQNLAMSHAKISFKYKNNDKLIFATKGDGDLKSVILSVYGKSIFNNISEIDCSKDFISIEGFIGNSEISKANRNYQSIFINGRYVKNKTVTAAVEAAYKSMLTINKFPMYVLHLYINPEFIDVNVHPAKSEIKFQDDQIVFKAVFHCIKDNLISISPITEMQNLDKNLILNEIPKINYTQQEMPINQYKSNIPVSKPMERDNYIRENSGNSNHNINYVKENNFNSNSNISNEMDKDIGPSIRTSAIAKFEPLGVVGQIHFTYIVAEGIEDMYLIDQHAAHERIYYESYMNEYKASSLQSQNMFVPIVIELTLSDKQQVLDNLDFFKKIGYEIDDFGGNSIALRCVPLIYGNPDNRELFNEILNNLDIKGKEIFHVIDKVIYTMACKSAVKAGDKLNYREMSELIEKLRFCDNPFTCPHGRPTIIKTSYIELEKKFKRIQ
jgi:DNA mismatch repair protein MutL